MTVKLKFTLAFILILASAALLSLPGGGGVYNDIIKPAELSTLASSAGTLVIPMDRSRTKADIVAMAAELAHSGFISDKQTGYDAQPVLSAPYATGSLRAEDIKDAENAIKMVRYIAGLPYSGIKLTSQLNDISQHGAALLAATGQFTHTPAKPGDMAASFYEKAYKGCSEANLYKGTVNISYAILGFMADPNDTNIGLAAHRRWMLKPGAENFGIGYADRITSLYVFDGLGPYECEADTYIAWPNSGDFPIEYFTNSTDINNAPAYPWSVNLGAAYRAPVRDKITLTLTRLRDGKVWVFDKNTPQLGAGNMPDSSAHLAVDNSGYGIGKAIIFRPSVTSLGAIMDGDEFTVSISGLETSAGAKTQLTYTIRFFSLQAELNASSTQSREFTRGEFASMESTPGAGVTAVPYYSVGGGTTVVKLSASANGSVLFFAPETALYRVKNNAKYFSDVQGLWSTEDIEFVTAREIFTGVGGTRFSPNGDMTRAMFITVLARLYGVNEQAYEGVQVFTDVAPGLWYSASAAWAYENGIADGVGGGRFDPGALVTRAQLAALIVRFAEFSGYSLSPVAEQTLFKDNETIAQWCADAVYTLQRAGIVSGRPGNMFDPEGTSTRAEASAVLRRFVEAVLLRGF